MKPKTKSCIPEKTNIEINKVGIPCTRFLSNNKLSISVKKPNDKDIKDMIQPIININLNGVSVTETNPFIAEFMYAVIVSFDLP